ncbi:MAG: pentaheme c-type cytochrome TorC [Pseudorhodobacter sp.]|nr:pentaheme c-type cytochrome TorC [Pseudorhodobacter sp.]
MRSKFTFSKSTWKIGLIVMAGMVVGVIAWGGFNTAMEATNSIEFCISCHEMRDTVYPEYKTTIHYSNPAGVRAICSDCHVPKEWIYKVIRKIQASNEIYHWLAGTIDTPEKFEARRLEYARHVWDTMKATDSRECRNCHSFDAMDFHNQVPKASKAMQVAMTDGSTCIDCHKGIAHKLPDMSNGYKLMFNDLMAASMQLNSAVGDTVYSLGTTPFFLERPATAETGAVSGKLLAATPVKIIARDGDWIQGEIAGWQQEGAERVLYSLQGKRIFVAALAPPTVEKVVQGPAIMDPDTEQNWNQATLTIWTTNQNLVADEAQLWAYGEEMYNSTCGLCHAAPPTDHYLANQWIGTLNAMKRFTPLDDEQYRLLQKYVQLHAKDTGDQIE